MLKNISCGLTKIQNCQNAKRNRIKITKNTTYATIYTIKERKDKLINKSKIWYEGFAESTCAVCSFPRFDFFLK